MRKQLKVAGKPNLMNKKDEVVVIKFFAKNGRLEL